MDKIKKLCFDAAKIELKGIRFYENLSDITLNAGGRLFFRNLASDEKQHYEVFKRIYLEHYSGECAFPTIEDLEDGIGSIFDFDIKGGGLSEKSDILDALNIGINSEKKSLEFYGEALKNESDETVRNILMKIISEEEKHLSILQNEIEAITKTGNFQNAEVV